MVSVQVFDERQLRCPHTATSVAIHQRKLPGNGPNVEGSDPPGVGQAQLTLNKGMPPGQ